METDRTSNSMRNLFYGMVSKIATLFMPFAVRTIIIYYIGIEYAGLNSLFTSLLNFLSLSELGFGSALVYMMYKPVAEDDKEKICAILNYYKKVYRFIGGFILVVGICLIPFLDKMINGSYPANINLSVPYLIFLGNTSVSYFLFAYKSALFTAYQRIDAVNKITAVIYLLSGLAQIFVLMAFRNYYYYAILIPIFTILQNIFIGIASKKAYPDLFCKGSLSKEYKKEIGVKVVSLTGHKIGGAIVISFDSIAISSILGLVALAKYSNYFMITSALMGIINIAMLSVLPSIGNYLINSSDEQKYALFRKLNFGLLWIIGWCTVSLLCLYQPFMSIWLGNDMLLDFSSVVWFCIYFYSWQFRVLGANFKDAAGLWNEDVLKPYVASIVNVILNIYLLNKIGLNGALISTIFCMFFIFFPWETRVLFRKLFHRPQKKFILEELFYFLLWCFIGGATYSLCIIVKASNLYLMLIIRAAICVIVPNLLYWLINHKKEEYKYFMGLAIGAVGKLRISVKGEE